MPRRWVAGVLVAGLLAAAVLSGARGVRAADDDEPGLSADQLGDATEEGSILQMLEPDEREALARSQMTGMRPEPEPKAAEPEQEGVGDTVGKVGISIASVALSVAAVVAPFFLF
jgi:hypothetical protein